MPNLYRIGGYVIFFWSNEFNEPIHIHIAKKKPTSNATKIWLTKSGGYIIANNKSRIVKNDLNEIFDVLSIHHSDICEEWQRHFKTDIKFYC